MYNPFGSKPGVLVVSARKGVATMKRILLLVVLTMATSSFTLAQMAADKSAPKGKTEQELTKLEQDRAQATVKGDTAFIEQNTADDYTFVSPRGALRTKAQIFAAFKSNAPKFECYELAEPPV